MQRNADTLRWAQIISLPALIIPPEPSVPQTPFPLSIKTPTGNPFSPGLATPITPTTGRNTQPNVFDMALQQAQGETGAGEAIRAEAEEADDANAEGEADAEWLDEQGNPLARMLNRVLGLLRGRYLSVLLIADALKAGKACAAGTGAGELDTAGMMAAHADGTGDEEDPAGRFQFLANVYWVEIADRVVSEIGSVLFAAGRVSELHRVSASRGMPACGTHEPEFGCCGRTTRRHTASSTVSKASHPQSTASSHYAHTTHTRPLSADGSCQSTSSCGGRKLLASSKRACKLGQVASRGRRVSLRLTVAKQS